MAIIHRAAITPTKQELATAWLDRQGLGGAGDVEMLGSYRFDDPAGEVGVEALLVRRGGEVFHLPVTYRGAPLDGAGAHLITTMEHSALGSRWVYEAAGDPVALACYVPIAGISLLIYYKIAVALRLPIQTGMRALIGANGEVIGPATTGGLATHLVRCRGEIWSVRTSEPLQAGDHVLFTGFEGSWPIVERVTESGDPAPATPGGCH